MGATQDAADRARDEIVDRAFRRRPALDHSPVGLHDQELGVDGRCPETALEIRDVVTKHRLQVRVGDDRVTTIVLSPARVDLVRERDREIG